MKGDDDVDMVHDMIRIDLSHDVKTPTPSAANLLSIIVLQSICCSLGTLSGDLPGLSSLFLKLSILYTAGDVGIYKMFHNELLYFVTAEIVVVPSLVVINVSFAFSINTG